MTIYIGTIIAGRNGGKPVNAMKFRNVREFRLYCDSVNECRDTDVSPTMNIGELCDTIVDKGPGNGSRWYRRITRQEAIATGVIYD